MKIIAFIFKRSACIYEKRLWSKTDKKGNECQKWVIHYSEA